MRNWVSVAVLMAAWCGLEDGRAIGQEPPRSVFELPAPEVTSPPSLGAERPLEAPPLDTPSHDFGAESNALGEARRQDSFTRQRGIVGGLGLLAGWRRRAALANPWLTPPPGLPFAPPAPPWLAGPWSGSAARFGPWSMYPGGAGYFNPARQPIGHEIQSDGRGGYSYRPLYEGDGAVVVPNETEIQNETIVPDQPEITAPRQPARPREPSAPRRAAPKPTPENALPEELPPPVSGGPVDL